MSEIIKAIVLGALEGVTEFLPISSTGHLILVGKSIHFANANTATFDIAIQLGAILAVVVAYFSIFKPLILPKNWFSPLWNAIVIATIPALILGALFHHVIKTHLFNPVSVAIALPVGGIIMIVVEKWIRTKKATSKITQLEDIRPKQALIIGISQCASLWPGMSRSASTIVGGFLAGLEEELAAKFSFIVAVPTMIAAVSYDMVKSFSALASQDFVYISIGFTVAFVVAYFSLQIMLRILKKYGLLPFAIYRILLGGFLLYVFF